MLEPFRGAGTYLDRGIEPASHAHPWHYYLGLLTYSSSGGLTWSEGLVLVLALVGAVTAWRARQSSRPLSRIFWARYLACDVAIAAAIFSAIPYKTPWNLLPFYVGAIVARRASASRGSFDATASRALRGALTAAFVDRVAAARMAGLARVGDLRRRPAQSVRLRADRARRRPHGQRASASWPRLHPDGARMQVSVIAPPYEQWPLPWYLRTMPNVGYWIGAG